MVLDDSKNGNIQYLIYSIVIYLFYTIIYFVYKNKNSTFQNKFISFFIYFSLLIISQGIIYILLEKSICESTQFHKSINVTIFSWIVCLGFVYLISHFLNKNYQILSINKTYNKLLSLIIIIIGIIISISSYFYLVNLECDVSVDDLQKEYTNYLDKLNVESKNISKRVYNTDL